MLFRDRHQAGRLLAEQLLPYRHENPIVLALPRGGVPIGHEIASRLGAPLDVVLVRKIRHPYSPELAIGAVAEGNPPELYVDRGLREIHGVKRDYLDNEVRRQMETIENRRELYRGGRPLPQLAGRTAILVDDGIATGATMKAALRCVRRGRPTRTVLAVPVAPPESIDDLRCEADVIVCLEQPGDFGAVGLFYQDFTQVEDATVIALLGRAS